MPRYTQGVMDVGATICTSRQPQCLICPVQNICKGYAQGEPEKYPVKTKKLKRSVEHLNLLLALKPDGSVWLERRAAKGVWGGLYCLPVFESETALMAFVPAPVQARLQYLPTFKHVLTHKDMHLSPVVARFSVSQKMVPNPANESGRWFLPGEWLTMGLPAPIRKLLE
jgi:A/G-specific adenine glycosylase